MPAVILVQGLAARTACIMPGHRQQHFQTLGSSLLNIQDAEYGLPRQPVALRLAPLVTQLDVEEILSFLCESVDSGRPVYMLEAFEFDAKGRHQKGTPQVYKALLSEAQNKDSFRARLKTLPANHFVWSDDLATAFSTYIDLVLGRDQASELGMGLRWNVPMSPYESLLGECPDFAGSNTPRSQRRKLKTAARNTKWKELVEKKQSENPSVSRARACELVARDLKHEGESVDAGTIRRTLYQQ